MSSSASSAEATSESAKTNRRRRSLASRGAAALASVRRSSASAIKTVRKRTNVIGTLSEAPPRIFALRKPPRQMQHWGEPQLHPHTNWFDLFFDLIFVGAAYQLGVLLKEDVNARGVCYFLTLMCSFTLAWNNKLMYDSRIDADDLVHKFFDMAEALLVATAALHIGGGLATHTPIQDFRDRPTGHAWGFSLANCALRLLNALRWFEVHAEKETKGSTFHSMQLLKYKVVAAAFYAAAAVLSNSLWVPNDDILGFQTVDAAVLLWFLASMWEQVGDRRLKSLVIQFQQTLTSHISYHPRTSMDGTAHHHCACILPCSL